MSDQVGAVTFDRQRLSVTSLNVPFFSLCRKKYAVVETHGQIGCSVVVIVSGRTSDGMNGRIKSSFLRHIFKLTVAKVVIQRHPALRTVVGQEKCQACRRRHSRENRRPAREKTRDHSQAPRRGFDISPAAVRHRHKAYRNRRQRFLHRAHGVPLPANIFPDLRKPGRWASPVCFA